MDGNKLILAIGLIMITQLWFFARWAVKLFSFEQKIQEKLSRMVDLLEAISKKTA